MIVCAFLAGLFHYDPDGGMLTSPHMFKIIKKNTDGIT